MSILDRTSRYEPGERRFTNGHSIVEYEVFARDYGQSLPILFPSRKLPSRPKYYRPIDPNAMMIFLPVVTRTPSPKRDPITEIARSMNTKKEVAEEIFRGLESEIDQICKEEKVELLDSEEKAELILGSVMAFSSLAKKISKRIK